MQHPSPSPHPSIGMRFGDHVFPAETVHLDGHRATVSLGHNQPLATTPTRLRLDWEDGQITELLVDLLELDGDRGVAHLAIRGVSGAWRPFMDYLGNSLN